MSRALIIVQREADRLKAVRWAQQAPTGTRIEFKAARRSLDQNAKMWALLTDVATQKTHMGRRYSPDQWKIIFLHACGREVQFVPALDGSTFLPFGQSSSDLSKSEMSDLIECIVAWGAQNNVVFSDQEQAA